MAGHGEPGEPAVMVKLEVASGKPWESRKIMGTSWENGDLPSGNLLHSCGKSACSMGKLTMSMAMASIAMLNYQRVAGIHASPYLTIEGIS